MRLNRTTVRITPAALLVAGCGGSCTNPVDPGDQACVVASATIAGPATVTTLESPEYTYTVNFGSGSPANCIIPTPTWSTRDPAVATIAQVGSTTGNRAVLSPIAPGTTEVRLHFPLATYSRSVTVTAPTATTLTVSPAAPSLGVNQTQQMTATCTAGNGTPITPCTPDWSIAPITFASISPSGLVTALAPGVATVTATLGTLSGQATVTVTAAPAVARIAYAMVDQAGAVVPGYDFNGLGGPMSGQRQAAGRYRVTLPGFGGAPGDSRLPLVNAVSAGATVCVAIDWTMIGVTDATVDVQCTDPAGTDVDSHFVLLAVGQGGLPGDFAFGYSGPVNAMPSVGTTLTLPAASAWSSGGSVQLRREGTSPTGRYLVLTGLPQAPPVAFAVVQAPLGAANSRCTLGSFGAALDVVCYPPGSISFGDAPFAGMLLSQGRPGMRIASVWANAPSTSSYQAPVIARRNSGGGAITISRSAVGTYQLVFEGLGRPDAGRREVVMVSTQALFAPGTCRLSAPWSTATGANLTVNVRCVNGAGTASDETFFVVVVE